MNWKKLLLWFKKDKKHVASNNFDKQLVRNITGGRLPNWTQFRYLPRFLNSKEKITLISFLTVTILSTLAWGGVFVFRHRSVVPKDGGEYTEALIGQPKLINPIFASVNDVDADLTSLLYSGLVRYDQNHQLTADLATDYTLSADKKTYTFNLRQNVKWSDGEPFNADDVIYTFETIQNPEVGSPLLPNFQGVKVEKKGDYTVSLTLKEPFAPFLSSLTVGILPEHEWGSLAPNSIKLAKDNLQPIGTGAWVFSKLVKDDTGRIQSYTLARNENYYAKKPYLKNATFSFYNDYSEAVDALHREEVTALSFVPHNLEDKINTRSLNSYTLKLPQYTALFFNSGEQLLKDKNLRVALAEALDKNLIVKESLGGEGEVINGPILSGQLGFNPNVDKVAFNIDDANKLLDKTWSRIQPEEYFQSRKDAILASKKTEIDDLKNDASSTPEMVSSTIKQFEEEAQNTARSEMLLEQHFYRKNKSGKILSLTITTADTPEYRKTAETVASMWRAIGVQVSIVPIAPRQITKEALKGRNYQILLYGEILGSDSDPFPFWHSSQVDYPGLNLAGFSNRTADKNLEDARTSNDSKTREDLYKKFQDTLAKELPAIFLYSPNYTFVANKSIKGINLDRILSPSDRYNDINNWYVKTRWIWKS